MSRSGADPWPAPSELDGVKWDDGASRAKLSASAQLGRGRGRNLCLEPVCPIPDLISVLGNLDDLIVVPLGRAGQHSGPEVVPPQVMTDREYKNW
jgi:hypothetical protein